MFKNALPAILLLFSSVFCFNITLVLASDFSFSYSDQQGDDYQVTIPGYDLSLYPNIFFDPNQQAQDDSINLNANDYLDPNGFSISCGNGLITTCLVANQIYTFTDNFSGNTVTFTTNFNAIPDFVPQLPPIQSDNIWHGGSMFGSASTSPVNMLASVAGGVQETGASIWPLFVFLGIPIAFFILYILVDFIYNSLYLGQSSILSSQSPKLDRAVYLPYKGYKRTRSRKWNRENTIK